MAGYQRDGFVVLREVLTQSVLGFYSAKIDQLVDALTTGHRWLEDRDTYGRAFLQVMNLWTRCEIVKELVFSRRLARVATELMGVSGVRLYHDQALYKERGGGITPWHRDQFYWPMSTEKICTLWIPLQDTPLAMGPASFAAGTQDAEFGGDLEIGDVSQELIGEFVRNHGYQVIEKPFRLGDVSFHSGRIFHTSGANTTDTMRRAMTIIYMDQDMVMAPPTNRFQEADWAAWLPGCEPGKPIETPLSPVLFGPGCRRIPA